VSSLTLPAHQTFAAIRDGIDRALALDPQLALAHRVKVQLSLLELDWPGALAHARRAIEISPSSAIAHGAYGEWLYTSGRFAEAEREWEMAREFDPLHVSYRYNLALLYALWRRYERSEGILQGILDLDPDHGAARNLLTMLYLMAKRWSKALAEAQESVRRLPNHPGVRLNLAQALAATGNANGARQVLANCEREFGLEAISPFQRAQLHALLGEVDDAFLQFDEAIAKRTTAIYHLPLDPGLEDLHADPRWPEMMERHRFPRIDTTGWRAAAIDEWKGRGGILLSD
jgi:tetratricopeptide (TPR) repeat protein